MTVGIYQTVKPLVAPGKGSMENRLECAGQQFANSAKTTVKSGLIAGSAIGATYAVGKSPKIAKLAHNGMKWVQTAMGKNKHTAELAKPLTDILKNYSTKGKVGLISAAIALPLLAITAMKGLYKSGQIDQKYTDKASVASQLNHFIG